MAVIGQYTLDRYQLSFFFSLLLLCPLLRAVEQQDLSVSTPALLQAIQASPQIGVPTFAADPPMSVLETRLHDSLQLDAESRFEEMSENVDPNGKRHLRLQQVYCGLSVYGKQVLVHRNAQGQVAALSGEAVSDVEASLSPQDAKTQQLSPKEAMHRAKAQALNYLGGKALSMRFSNEKIERVIYINKAKKASDAYSVDYFVEAKNAGAARPHFILDADSGTVLEQWNGMTDLLIGTGAGGNTKTGRYEYGVGGKPFLDVKRAGSTCTMNNGAVRVVDFKGEKRGNLNAPVSFDCPHSPDHLVNESFGPLNDLYYYGTVVDRLFNELTGARPLRESVVLVGHYDVGLDNAFWNGRATYFGDGKNKFYSLGTSLNIVAHEVSHGFTEQHSGLVYRGQSGGINEAFSDMAGETAEFYLNKTVDWQVAADATKTQPALRYLADPKQDGRSIDNAAAYTPKTNVHYSSGVYNYAFYRLATLPGWNPLKALKVFHDANANYWTAQTDFSDGACGVISAGVDQGFDPADIVMAFQAAGVSCPIPIGDADGDGIKDQWEQSNDLTLAQDNGGGDPDRDGLSNLEEAQNGSDPHVADTDGDGLSDAADPFPHDTILLRKTRFAEPEKALLMRNAVVLSRDVDKDGYAETIIGLPHYAKVLEGKRRRDVGIVIVFSGKSGKVLWQKTGSEADGAFGRALAVFDNKTGENPIYLAITAPGALKRDASERARMAAVGVVKIYRMDHLNEDRKEEEAAPVREFWQPQTTAAFFGASIAYVGQGWLLVGAPNADNGKQKKAGVAHLFNLDPSVPAITLHNPMPSTGEHFGAAVARLAGDDGQGKFRLLVGAPEANRNHSGSVFLYAFDPLVKTAVLLSETKGSAGSHTGTVLLDIGDNDANGEHDFAIGVPKEKRPSDLQTTGALIVCHVFVGVPSCVPHYGEAKNTGFASSLANMGNIEHNGKDAVLVGSPSFSAANNSKVGRVQLFSGESWRPLWSMQGENVDNRLGFAVAAGDVNNDGAQDAVIASAAKNDIRVGAIKRNKSAKLANSGAVSVLSGLAKPDARGLIERQQIVN